MNLTVVIFSVAGIYIGGNWLIAAVSRLARSFKVPQVVVGLTVISLVTVVPEIIIAVRASAQGAAGVVLGMVAGSNIANMGLILGISGLLAGGLPIATGLVRRGIPTMLVIAGVIYGLLWLGEIGQTVGIILIVAFVVFNIGLLRLIRRDSAIKQIATTEMQRTAKIETQDMLLVDDENIKEIDEKISRSFEFTRLIFGIAVLLLGANALADNALIITTQLNANEVAVGASVIALAASLPELIAVLVATRREQPDVAVGNIVGSNIANLLLVVGIAAFVQPLWIDNRLRWYEFPVMLAMMLLLIPVIIDRKLTIWESGLFFVGYVAFWGGIFIL